MVTVQRANYSLNISLHVLILFTFLTIFFFTFISHLEQKSVNSALKSAITEQVGHLLTSISTFAQNNINWVNVYNVAEKIQKDSQGELQSVKQNHKRLLYTGLGMIGFLILVFTGLLIYYRSQGIKIGIKKIFLENALVFSFVGLIEFLFFTKVASKYIPVTPDVLSKTILERVKYRFNEYAVNNSK